MKKVILCFFILMATSSSLWADTVTFDASVNSPRVSLDQVLQLTLTVTGVSDNLDPVSLPVIDGFTAKYLGPSSSTSFVFVNGKSEQNSSRSFIYNLFPNKVGKFEIPTISATIAGQTYKTQPIDVEVVETSSAPSDQNQAPSAESLKDKIVLTATVDKTDVYLNERVPLTIKLLVNGVPIRDIQYPQFEKQGFLMDDFEKPQQSSDIFNGVRYDTVEFKTNIYPDHSGDLTLGPVQLQGNVLYKTGQNNTLDQDNSFFGAQVFNNFFDSYAARPVTVRSDPIQLHVSPLPSANRPTSFSGAIGNSFDFKASVTPVHVKVGDPLTLKMEIMGNGNFKNMKMPEFQAPGFKTYAPQIKDTGNERSAEQVIIPTSAGVKEVPGLSFSYFDTSIKDYKTITQGPFAVQVTALSPDQEFKAVGFTDVSHEGMLPSNQFFLGKLFNKALKFLEKLIRSIWFWVSLGVVLVISVSWLLWRRFQDRFRNDSAFRRRHIAVREARQALDPAGEYISKGKTKDLYALLSKVLRDYLANKWHQSSAALSTGEILNHLKSVQLDETSIGQIKDILEQSDLVCFAGATADPNKMQADLSRTRDLIAHLEKSLK